MTLFSLLTTLLTVFLLLGIMYASSPMGNDEDGLLVALVSFVGLLLLVGVL